MNSIPASPSLKVRVRRATKGKTSLAAATIPSKQRPLAHDSLGWSLILSARVLAQVRSGKSLNGALSILFKESSGARSAAQDIAYGVLRHFGQGEFILAKLLSRPLPHEEIRALLLSALYRLDTREDSEHMVVDQAVTAAGEMAAGAFKGFVNGVLRNYLRQKESLFKAMEEDDEVFYMHPRWWLNRLRRTYPDQWREIARAGNTPPPMTLRVNRRRVSIDEYVRQLDVAGLSARALGQCTLILNKSVGVNSLPGFAEGLVSVQDAGAQRAAQLLAPVSGSRVLDACAAPGGKTSHLLEMADLDLLALDIDAARICRIEENLKRLGLSAKVKTADCTQPESWWDGRLFDSILADVPCSASGVVKRHPDIKTLRRESDIRRFAHMQTKILDVLWPLLKPGGKLLYATCSVFVEENTAQIDAFLFRQTNAQRMIEEQWLMQDENDGFFYSLLRKTA